MIPKKHNCFLFDDSLGILVLTVALYKYAALVATSPLYFGWQPLIYRGNFRTMFSVFRVAQQGSIETRVGLSSPPPRWWTFPAYINSNYYSLRWEYLNFKILLYLMLLIREVI